MDKTPVRTKPQRPPLSMCIKHHWMKAEMAESYRNRPGMWGLVGGGRGGRLRGKEGIRKEGGGRESDGVLRVDRVERRLW